MMRKIIVLIIAISFTLQSYACKTVKNNETSISAIDNVTENATENLTENAEDGVDLYDVDADNAKSRKDAGIKEEKIDSSLVEDGYTYIDIKYPVLTSTKGEENIQTALDVVNDDLKKAAEKFYGDNKDTVKTDKEETGIENYHLSHDSTDVYVTRRDDKHLSIRVFTYEDYMGAHPIYYISGYNFDVNTGKKLNLYDVIKDKEEFRKYLYEWCEEHSEEDMIFEEEYKETIDNYVDEKSDLQFFFYDIDKLCVIFQIYDIAPYAVGVISVEIPKELRK